jgi:large subunit ribosomal protein L10
VPLERSEKEAFVEEMSARLKEAEVVVLADYRGLDVAQISRLRREMRDTGAEFRVVKNTLTLLAFEEAGITPPTDLLEGPTALALFSEDLSGPAKVLLDFAKETEILQLKGGVMAGERIALSTITTLSELPSRDELLASFAGVLQAPLREYVTVLSAPLQSFVSVLKAKSAS